MVWEGVCTLLLGLAKQGKTYLAVQLALCLASGRQFLGLETRSGKVLYMSWEITLAGLRDRMRNIARDAGLPDPDPLFRNGHLALYAHTKASSVPRLDLGEAEDWPRLAQLLQDVKPDVLVIDTLRKACPGIELKDDIGWSRALANFNSLARVLGISIILIDHGHRARTGETAAAFAMGSQVKGSDVPWVAKLERRRVEGEADRWKLEVEGWYEDPGTPIWYERPEDQDGIRGCGCVLCDPPAIMTPTKKAETTVFMESWLRDRLGTGSVSSDVIFSEACEHWGDLGGDTLKRKASPRPPCDRWRYRGREGREGSTDRLVSALAPVRLSVC